MVPIFTQTMAVAMGGAAGAVARFALGRVMPPIAIGSAHFPLGTLAANLIGCFFIGLLYGLLHHAHPEGFLHRLVFAGFLGAFTTFSTFSWEMHGFINSGHLTVFVMYVLVSVLAGLLLTWLGFLLTGGAT